MAGEKELETALLKAYEQTKEKVNYTARRFKPMLERYGAVGTAKRLLRPHKNGKAQTGFNRVVAEGYEELTVESIVQQPEFRRLFTREELAEARHRLGRTLPADIIVIADAINRRAQGRPIGMLQTQRAQRHGLGRVSTLFDRRSIKTDEGYAYHVGGQSELQFNIGLVEMDGEEVFRHGVAFSLQPTRSMPSIDGLIPKIEKFNEFIRLYPETFAGLTMWHSADGKRSNNYPPVAISDELVRPNVFIFLGAVQIASDVDIEWALDDFDRLMPLYQYVEGEDRFPRTAPRKKSGYVFTPGNAARASRSTYTREAGTVNKSLRHNAIQRALYDHLERIHGRNNASGEQNTGNGTLIDVAIRTTQGDIYYEIKTALSAQGCIREALGQLMEYSYWPGAQEAAKLVIVGEPQCDGETQKYLRKIRKRFALPIFYQQFDIKTGKLV